MSKYILETVKVKHEDGFMIINKKDFDAKVHQLFEEKKSSVVRKKKTTKKKD